jgi:bifunctional DNA-binding transcriptional regulator/antitoxin component of YhaV-PrlF toxin-antitoxin module
MEPLITTLTERGQTSIPALLRQQLHLETGQKLRWQKVSDREFRVELVDEDKVPGPLAMLGHARRFQPDDRRGTDAWMRELREGERT